MASNLQFVSWSRRGVAVGKDVGAPRPDDGRLHVTRRLTVWSTVKDELPISQEVETATLTVFGPGDVTGIDPSQIVRRAPRPDDQNLEPNYLACIEFAHPDLPWMFSPEPQLSEEKAHPWLMLVVVPFVDDKQVIAGPVGKPCPVLYLPAADVTPDPGDAWAFAHVQARTTGSPVDLIRAANADLVRSRLICPTHLRPDTHYLAAVVPTYEIGRSRPGDGDPGRDRARALGASSTAPTAGIRLVALPYRTQRGLRDAGEEAAQGRTRRRRPRDPQGRHGGAGRAHAAARRGT